jgi:hypothetical protein
MAVANYAASVQGVALRVTRLNSLGTPLTGPEDVYVTRAFMRVSFTPEYEEGDEVTEKNAAGEVCVTYKSNDTLKRATMELAICDPDPELTELLTGGVLLRLPTTGYPPGDGDTGMAPNWPTKPDGSPVSYPNNTIGYASVKVNESPNPNGVGVEVWSRAIRDGAMDTELPYYRWVFPKATLRPSGDRVIENGLLANAFEGWSVGNMYFGTGPADDWYWPDATDRPYLYARDWQQPWVSTNGWYDYGTAVNNPGEKPEIVGPTGVSEPNPLYGPTMPTGQAYLHYIAENPGPTGIVFAAGAEAPSGPATRPVQRPAQAPAPTGAAE